MQRMPLPASRKACKSHHLEFSAQGAAKTIGLPLPQSLQKSGVPSLASMNSLYFGLEALFFDLVESSASNEEAGAPKAMDLNKLRLRMNRLLTVIFGSAEARLPVASERPTGSMLP